MILANPITEESATVGAENLGRYNRLVPMASRCRLDVAGANSIASCWRHRCP
jgi:hypothetical protein